MQAKKPSLKQKMVDFCLNNHVLLQEKSDDEVEMGAQILEEISHNTEFFGSFIKFICDLPESETLINLGILSYISLQKRLVSQSITPDDRKVLTGFEEILIKKGYFHIPNTH